MLFWYSDKCIWWDKPADNEPTKVSRNLKITMKKFCPGAWLFNEDIVLHSKILLNLKQVIEYILSAEIKSTSFEYLYKDIAIYQLDSKQKRAAESSKYRLKQKNLHYNSIAIKTYSIIQDRFSKHQSIKVRIYAKFLQRASNIDIYLNIKGNDRQWIKFESQIQISWHSARISKIIVTKWENMSGSTLKWNNGQT